MRNTFFFFLCFFLQNTLIAQEEIIYSDVLQVEGNPTQEELFVRARYWFAELLDQSDKELEIEDKEAGRLFARSLMPYRSNGFIINNNANGDIAYQINLQIKEGAYEYKFSGFTHYGNISSDSPIDYGFITKDDLCMTNRPPLTTKGRVTKICEDLRQQIDAEMNLLISSLERKMNSATELTSGPRKDAIVYTDFVGLPNTNQAKVYEQWRLWFAEYFPNSKEVLEIEDKELGELYGSAAFPYESALFGRDNYSGWIWYTMRIQAKENGYQFTITDFEHRADLGLETPIDYGYISIDDDCFEKRATTIFSTEKSRTKTCVELKEIIDANVRELILSFPKIDVKGHESKIVGEGRTQLVYTKTIPLEGLSKEEIYDKTRYWFTIMFPNSDEILEIEDKEAGELYAKIAMNYDPPLIKGGGMVSKGFIWHSLRVKIEDGQCQYIAKEFFHEADMYLDNPLSFGPITIDDICFEINNVLLSKKRRMKYCEYIKECIDTNMNLLERKLEESLKEN